MLGVLFLLMLTDSQWLECKVKNPYSPGEGNKVTIKVMKPSAGFEKFEQRLKKFRLLAGDLVLVLVENRTNVRFDLPGGTSIIVLNWGHLEGSSHLHPLQISHLDDFFSWEEISYASTKVSVSPDYVTTRFAGAGRKWKDVTGGFLRGSGVDFEVKGKAKKNSKLGRDREALKRRKEALKACDKAIELKPDDAQAWANKGAALHNLRRDKEALKACDKAIELKSDLAQAWANKGNALNSLHRYEEALKACNKAIELKPDLAQAWMVKGCALNNLGRYEEGDKAIKKSKELSGK